MRISDWSSDVCSSDLDQNNLNYKRLNDFIKTVDGNCGEKVLISDVAQDLGFSVDTFEKLSKEIFQLTPKQLLLQRRIERTCDLLDSSDNSFTQVATECGHSDNSAFTRQFKFPTQLPPHEFRPTKPTPK